MERSTTVFTIDVEPRDVLFGVGTAGRVPAAGDVHVATYRYGTSGKVDGGIGAYSHVTGRSEIDGWISDGTADTSLDYRLVLCTG